MDFAIKRNNISLPVTLIADQCYDLIAEFPKDYEKVNLRKQVMEASRLSNKLVRTLKGRDYVNDWRITMDMPLRPKHMNYREMCVLITRTGNDIEYFREDLEEASRNFAMLFEAMKVTDNSMRPFDMRDDLFIVKFYEHLSKVQTAVNRIEKNLETLKSSVEDRLKKKNRTGQCESPLPQYNKRIKFSCSYNYKMRNGYTR